MAERWRLLIEAEPATGWWNMALDETLLAAVAAGARPTLRLYAWDGAWLSLGHAQPFDAGALAAHREAGVEVLRRVTGGRAVLHGRDLTYAIAAPEAALPGGLLESYRALSDALLVALRGLGVEAERARGGRGAPRARADFDCFAEAAADELCAGGRKLAGSAQRRAGGALLQHGSIRLADDPAAAARVARTGQGATSLAAFGWDPEAARGALVEALPRALAERLGVAFESAALDPEERREAQRRAETLRLDPLARRAGPASRAP